MGYHSTVCRRNFLASTAAIFGTAVGIRRVPHALGFDSPNERPTIGVVGCGLRWDKRVMDPKANYGLGKQFPKFGDIVAVCDVDSQRAERARGIVKDWASSAPLATGDYRRLIDDPSINILHIVTPDHWHAKIAIEGMLAGKDIYCEKPMTLTIDEGKLVREVQKKTGSVFQVGTQQRSGRQFVKAVAMIRDGRLGELKRVVCGIDSAPQSPPLPVVPAPRTLDWNRWLGPAPKVGYRAVGGAKNIMKEWSNGHYEFRWWYDYSGGKLTDWGAHHLDIATWGMGKTDTGPIRVDPIMVEHPVEFKNGYPVQRDRYNTASKFHIKASFADGVELIIRHDTDNGILFEGTEGRMFVNRGKLVGKPVEDLAETPLPPGALEKAYKNQPLTDHVSNFFRAVAARSEPISDVSSHHRALSTCHLAGIAARLGRTLHWDAASESIVGDREAESFIGRPKRKGYEIEM